MTPRAAADTLKAWAREAGFDAAGVTTVEPPANGQAFVDWLAQGAHAGMTYLERRVDARLAPATLLDAARSVLCVALRYWPLAGEGEPAGDLWPRVARYARGVDYHELMERRLDALAARVEEAFPSTRTRRYVDTGPVLERELAARAGIGVVGKNTMLLEREMGSWFLLGELFTTLELAPDEPLGDLCGGCTLCLEACPTGALVAPYRLDSGRCISYWTIEHRGELPAEARAGNGDWVFGCDVCQEVCPWNRRRHALAPADHPELALAAHRRELDLAGLLHITRDEYVERFRGSSMKRAKLDGLRRNAAVAMGNRADGDRYADTLAAAAEDDDACVREHARWALARVEAAVGAPPTETPLE
jgi:epoxyqueuosine reductase